MKAQIIGLAHRCNPTTIRTRSGWRLDLDLKVSIRVPDRHRESSETERPRLIGDGHLDIFGGVIERCTISTFDYYKIRRYTNPALKVTSHGLRIPMSDITNAELQDYPLTTSEIGFVLAKDRYPWFCANPQGDERYVSRKIAVTDDTTRLASSIGEHTVVEIGEFLRAPTLLDRAPIPSASAPRHASPSRWISGTCGVSRYFLPGSGIGAE